MEKDPMLKVLVIDADTGFASLLGRELVKLGHEARIVGDAKYGIVRAKAFQPDLVLVANNVPGVVGAELIEELKTLVSGRIVVCAGDHGTLGVKEAITAGATDYVLKSSGIEAIIARTCKSDASDNPGEGHDAAGSDESDDDAAPEPTGVKRTPSAMLRAPLQDGKRPFCVIVAHVDGEKRAFITEILERLNRAIRVVEVKSSMDAITACAENRTVMLVIDWEMPDLSARQVMSSVKKSPHGKTISMFVTYKGHSPEKQRVAMFAGALAFAGEPWDDGSLEGQLKQTLDLIRKRRRRAKMKALQSKAS